MSRSVLAVAGALFALGVLVWFLTTGRDQPVALPAGPARLPTAAMTSAGPPGKPAAAPAPVPPGMLPTTTGAPPRITSRDDLVRVLTARGLDAEKLLTAYQDWRVAHGFLDADPLMGLTAENAPSQIYAAMDRATQKSLADSGDLGALQAYAAGSLPADPLAAVAYYGRASELGSAAAMAEIAGILTTIGNLDRGNAGDARPHADRLRALLGGDPNRDLGQDAVAWTLAAIRRYGPVVATPGSLTQVDGLVVNADDAMVASTCARSLAILADLSAASAGRNTTTLPPVFIAEKALYDRLPCGNTPAPVMPPRALANCAASPAVGSSGQPVELWICEGN